MKIAILGYSGCGKSTLAKHLSLYFDIPVLYLDTVQFEAGWKERDREEAAAIVAEFLKGEDWVIDGNYASFSLEERLEQADHIIYLKFSRWSCLYRVLKRYFRYRNTTRESMAEGCCEKLDLPFVWWVLVEGRTKKRREQYEGLIHRYPQKLTVLKNQRQLDRFYGAPFGEAIAGACPRQ